MMASKDNQGSKSLKEMQDEQIKLVEEFEDNEGYHFFCPMQVPTKTFQAKQLAVNKSGKPYIHDSQEQKNITEMYRCRFAKFIPKSPFLGAIKLKMMWNFDFDPSPDEKNFHYEGEPMTGKPDHSNLIKCPEDVLTELKFWIDDSYISESHEYKKWSHKYPGVYVSITPLNIFRLTKEGIMIVRNTVKADGYPDISFDGAVSALSYFGGRITQTIKSIEENPFKC